MIPIFFLFLVLLFSYFFGRLIPMCVLLFYYFGVTQDVLLLNYITLQSSLSSRISPTDMHLQETCMYPTGLPPQVGTCSKTPPNTTCCPSTIAQLHSCSRHIVFGSAFCTIAVWKPREMLRYYGCCHFPS